MTLSESLIYPNRQHVFRDGMLCLALAGSFSLLLLLITGDVEGATPLHYLAVAIGGLISGITFKIEHERIVLSSEMHYLAVTALLWMMQVIWKLYWQFDEAWRTFGANDLLSFVFLYLTIYISALFGAGAFRYLSTH